MRCLFSILFLLGAVGACGDFVQPVTFEPLPENTKFPSNDGDPFEENSNDDQSSQEPPVEQNDQEKKYNCSVKSERVELVHGSKSLPQSGTFVRESHLASIQDTFPQNRLFPRSKIENINLHINRSCNLLLKNYLFVQSVDDCAEIYSYTWDREWTPPESGKAGQGSVGDLKPSVIQEMWSGNMYWTKNSKPRPGEKFLVSNRGLNVVIAMGFETGPGQAEFLGGLQPEVMWYLGADNKSSMRLGRLNDQNLAYGPVLCQ